MQFKEVIAVCSENCTKYINMLCGQIAVILDVKAGAVYSTYCTVSGETNVQ
jgi:hypothetical protein